MRRTLLLLAFSAVLLSALPVLAQPVSNNAQRIVQTDGTHIDAASPLPITGTVTLTAETGAGATTADTLRTVTSTDSPDVTSLGTLDNVVGATSAATPTSAVLMGAADSVSGTMMPLRIYDADTGAGNDYRLGVVPILPGAGGGTPASAGAGAVDAGTIRVVEASIASGTSDHVDVDASEVAVLAAKAGRRYARVQVYSDVDGGVCCALGATTNACADGILLDASPAAGKAGGSAEWEGYGGAITCRAAGAWTTTVATEEW
jgi:hypothetical protein